MTTVTVICGGRSVEHEVSLRSAFNIVNGFVGSQYETNVIAVDKNGAFRLISKDVLERIYTCHTYREVESSQKLMCAANLALPRSPKG